MNFVKITTKKRFRLKEFNEQGKLIGDCEKDLPVAFQSPVPGGCGLLTRLAVIENLIKLEDK